MEFSIIKNMMRLCLILLVLSVGSIPAQAKPIQVDFTAINFGATAPTDPLPEPSFTMLPLLRQILIHLYRLI